MSREKHITVESLDGDPGCHRAGGKPKCPLSRDRVAHAVCALAICMTGNTLCHQTMNLRSYFFPSIKGPVKKREPTDWTSVKTICAFFFILTIKGGISYISYTVTRISGTRIHFVRFRVSWDLVVSVICFNLWRMIHSGCCFLFHRTFNHATLMFLRRPMDFYCLRREVPGLHIKGLHNLTQACFSASLLCCPEVPDDLLAAKYRLCVLRAEHWSNPLTAPSPQSFPMAGGTTFSCFWNPLRIFSY